MPRGIKTGAIPPDNGMLSRIQNKGGRANILPDKDELRRYIHERMDEGHLSVNRCAKEMGIRRTALQTALTEGESISYDLLARLLWIVDGDDCPYVCIRKDEGRVMK